jgi:LacI family transcriptional regulator
MNNATLKKLSEMLGLSISTVSRALKNHPDISEKTKVRVKELANAVDYEPNTNAIQLRTSKNNLFGLIVPTILIFFMTPLFLRWKKNVERRITPC